MNAREYEQAAEATRREHETDLEYLRRARPDMPENARFAYMFWSAIAGKPVRSIEQQESEKVS